MLRPLRTITAAARHISASNLHQRLAMTGPDDELKELGDTFDELLGRLDARSGRSASSSPTRRTSCAPRWPGSGPWSRSRWPTGGHEGLARTPCERVLAAGAQQERLIEALLTLARSQRGLDTLRPLQHR